MHGSSQITVHVVFFLGKQFGNAIFDEDTIYLYMT